MKFILALVICSQVQQTCLPPYQWPDTFDSQYDCLMFGYEESMAKTQRLETIMNELNAKVTSFRHNNFSLDKIIFQVSLIISLNSQKIIQIFLNLRSKFSKMRIWS